MRTRTFAAAAVLLAMLPLTAGASTTSGDLALSPAHGAPGSHFTATFSFTEAPCDAYTVAFFWDPSNRAMSLGQVDASGAGPTCQVSMDLVVPSSDAAPNHSYTVGGYAGTKQVNAGNASFVMGSSKDSGIAQFAVTGSAPASPGGSEPRQGSTPAPTGSTSGATGSASAAGTAATSSSPPGTSPSPDAAVSSPSSNDTGTAPPLTIQPPHPPAGGGNGGAILPAAVILALLAVATWMYRSGRFRTLLRR